MRTSPAFLILTFVLVLSASCRDSTGPESSPAGTYNLESINASPLPYEIFGIEIVSGSLTLNRDNTYSGRSTVRYVEGGRTVTENETEAGTYTRTGNTLRITSNEGDAVDATYDGMTLTINAGFIVAVYRRQ